MSNKICPLCQKKLSLKQIDFTTAVYICDDLQCKYPIGYRCIEVYRKLEDINKDIELLRAESTDNWISEIVENRKTQELMNNSPPKKQPKINILSNEVISQQNPSEDFIKDLIENTISEFESVEHIQQTQNQTIQQQIADKDFDDILEFMFDV